MCSCKMKGCGQSKHHYFGSFNLRKMLVPLFLQRWLKKLRYRKTKFQLNASTSNLDDQFHLLDTLKKTTED